VMGDAYPVCFMCGDSASRVDDLELRLMLSRLAHALTFAAWALMVEDRLAADFGGPHDAVRTTRYALAKGHL
jgi:hypothetical protein